MLKDFVFFLLGYLPLDTRNDIIFRVQMLTQQNVLRKWERRGKPVPAPHIIKQSVIKEYQTLSKHTILVETGTYLGHMIEAQKNTFEKIYSIELSPKYWNLAKKKFRNDTNVELILGDSSVELPNILANIHSPTIFWLDGHYSLGTAKGDLGCPIFGEIESIFNTNFKNHILLIDDARDFNGTNDYPTLSQLKDFIIQHRPSSSFEVKDDIIRILLN